MKGARPRSESLKMITNAVTESNEHSMLSLRIVILISMFWPEMSGGLVGRDNSRCYLDGTRCNSLSGCSDSLVCTLLSTDRYPADLHILQLADGSQLQYHSIQGFFYDHLGESIVMGAAGAKSKSGKQESTPCASPCSISVPGLR